MKIEHAPLLMETAPGEGGPDEARKIPPPKWNPRRPRGDWEMGPDMEAGLVAFLTGATAFLMKNEVIPEGGDFHESFLTPFAPHLIPLLFGITIAQMDSVAKTMQEGKLISGVGSGFITLGALLQTLGIIRDGVVVHDASTLVPAGLLAAGVILGRAGKPPVEKTAEKK